MYLIHFNNIIHILNSRWVGTNIVGIKYLYHDFIKIFIIVGVFANKIIIIYYQYKNF